MTDKTAKQAEGRQEPEQKQQADDWRSYPASNGRPRNTGQWVKGQSGNPGGRAGAQKLRRKLDVQQLAQEQTKASIRALTEIVRDKSAPPAARANAAGTLLDRGWGRAPQTIEHKGKLETAILDLITGLDRQKPAEDSENQPDQPLH